MREEDGIIAVQNQLKTLPQPNYSLLRFLWYAALYSNSCKGWLFSAATSAQGDG